jgi:Restriction endonuclease
MSDGDDAQSVAPAEAGRELAADLGDAPGVNAGAARRDDAGGDDAGDDEGEEEGAEGADGPAQAGGAGALGEDGRRRRRRRRRRGGSESAGEGGGRPPEASGDAASAGDGAFAGSGGDAGGNGEPRATDAAIEAESQGPRRIMTPVDAAVEVLRGQAPGRGIAVRQIAETAARRRLVHGEPNEAWRVMRAALAAEPRERLRAGQRPRIKAAGAGLFALARRPPDAEVERAELVFAEARRALRERTLASLERRIAELPPPAFEALARVLLQREGFGPATFVKRIEETIYVEALRGRGSRPSKALIALRSGGTTAGRRAVGELRAGIGKRGQDEGLLMLGGRLDGEAISEWKKAVPPVEIADGQAMAETCIRHGIGVISANVSVDFVDADFFAELSEG